MVQLQTPKLSGAVGQNPRPNKGPQPKNAGADVQLVQELLNQAGVKVPVNGRYDERLVEGIKQFQKTTLKQRDPDGVIDVNQSTFKKLVEIAEKQAAKGGNGQATESQEKYREFTYKGTTYTLTEDDYKAAVKETAAKLMRIVDALESQCDTLDSVQRDMRHTIEGGEGLMQAVCAFATHKWAGLDVPDFKHQPKARMAVAKAKSAVKKENVADAPKLISEAHGAVKEFDREVGQYRNKLIGAGDSIITTLEITRDTSFTVAEYIGTAVLVSRGSNPKVAKTSAAAFFAALKSGATEVGEHMADPKREWGTSAEKIVVDTLVATGTSVIANGFKGDSIKKWAGSIAPKLAGTPPFKQLGEKAVAQFVEKALSEGGQKIAKDGMCELMKTFGEMAKKGRTPTAAEVEKQLLDYLKGELSGALLKKFQGANWKFSRQLEDVVEKKALLIDPKFFNKFGKAERAKLVFDITKKVGDEITKLTFDEVVEKVSPSASENEIANTAVEVAKKNRKIEDLIKKELEKQQKKSK
jgi:peptidoglycan hydrolase-like protein with peptidoglycan-binding domain